MKYLAMSIGLLVAGSIHAADLFYKKSSSLYVIHDVELGKSESRKLETSIGKYVADAGAVIYLKNNNLYLIRDTRNPKTEILDSGVTDFKFQDGMIAYVRDAYLYVRLLAEDVHEASRRVLDAQGVSDLDVTDGTIVFLKNTATVYRVTDIERGTAERVIYPAGEIQVSSAK